MQRAQSSRPGGQTEEQQREASSLSGSRGRAEDDRVRIRVSGRRVDNKSQSNADDSAQENQSGKKKGVKWDEGVVDNEHMCKKKSKKCCIFHKRREFGEWSDDDSNSEDECSCH